MTAPVFIRLKDVQDTHGISRDTVDRWCARGLLQKHKAGARIASVRKEDLDRVMGMGDALGGSVSQENTIDK